MSPGTLPVMLDRPVLALVLLALSALACWGIARRSWAEGSRRRHRVALLCRITLMGLLALALSGLQWRRQREDVAVSFAVDSSDSVRGSREAALAMLREAAGAAKPGDRIAIVQFGRDALIERGLGEDVSGLALASLPRPDATDVEGALRLARGLLPADGRRRLVLMTDGAVTGEDPAGALRALRDDGLDVVLVPLGAEAQVEVLVDEIAAPERVHQDEPFEVRVVLRASHPSTGMLTITRDGRLIGRSEVEVPAGMPTAFRFVDRSEESGTRLYRAHFDADDDGFEQNDAAETVVRVEGQPSVLIVDPDPAGLAPVLALLQAAGLDVLAASPERLPRSAVEAGRHAAIVLSNVDSLHATTRQMEALRAFVRESGGGLLMAGGPDSFGPGGWYATPVEEVLPVDMDVRNEKYFPSLTLILALDKSGSMSGVDGASKMDLAKEAARQSAMLLQRGDRLGVIAFDSSAKLVVDPDAATLPPEATRLIGTIRSGGGTDIYTALVVAEEKFASARTSLKHLIVLSDGQSPPRDYLGILSRLAKAGVTTSTVAVGADADLVTMQEIARAGGGRFYFTDDPGSIPRIFTKEAFTTARSFVVEESFVPEVSMTHPVLRGATPLPAALGYVAVSPKPAAEVALLTPRGDPLLALRSFGLGRTAALTTDLGQRWASSWLTAPEGRALLAQLLRWTSSRSDSPLLEASLHQRAGRIVVSVEARDDAGSFLNFAELRAGVVGPDQSRQEVLLRQVAPGRYEAEVEDRGSGAWIAGVVQSAGGKMIRGATTARVFPYSEEYRTLQPAGDALQRLALASGARIEHDASRLFDRHGPPAMALRPAWRELILLAAMLLLLDVGLRRVMLPEGWAARASARLRSSLRPAAISSGGTDRLSRLREVKAGARAQAESGAQAKSGAVAQAQNGDRAQAEGAARADAGSGMEQAAAPAAGGSAGARPPVPPPAPRPASPAPPRTPTPAPAPSGQAEAEEPASAEAFRSRLLAAKRRARSEPRERD